MSNEYQEKLLRLPLPKAHRSKLRFLVRYHLGELVQERSAPIDGIFHHPMATFNNKNAETPLEQGAHPALFIWTPDEYETRNGQSSIRRMNVAVEVFAKGLPHKVTETLDIIVEDVIAQMLTLNTVRQIPIKNADNTDAYYDYNTLFSVVYDSTTYDLSTESSAAQVMFTLEYNPRREIKKINI